MRSRSFVKFDPIWRSMSGFRRAPGYKVLMPLRVQPPRTFGIGSLRINWVIIMMGSFPLFVVLKPFGYLVLVRQKLNSKVTLLVRAWKELSLVLTPLIR